jgi:hypothetical protein
MKIVGVYSFNGGENAIKTNYPHLLTEIVEIIESIDAKEHKIKKSKEKTMSGKILYSPTSLNKAFKKEFAKHAWKSHKEKCNYSIQYYTKDYTNNLEITAKGAFREMDFVKEKLGVEVQFGKYAFMVYNVCAKMTIFNKKGVIDMGIEIVPIKEFANDMSTGVSYFEQFVWDLENRGVSNIDIPVLILGVTE